MCSLGDRRWWTALRPFATDVTVFCHFIAINVAVGAALGDDRLIVFRPDNGSITKIAANNASSSSWHWEAKRKRASTDGWRSVAGGARFMRMFEFRSVAKEEMPALRRLGRYVFGDSDADEEDDDILRPEWTHAAFHQGRLVASSAGYPFKVRLNGRGAPADGVTAVGTNPGYRRRGLLRRLMGDLLVRARENGQPVSILWASLGAIYQRFGYGLASAQVEYDFDPRFADFQFGAPASGFTRMAEKDEAVPVISDLYRRFIEPRNLLLHRAPALWQLPFRRKKPNWHCAIHYDGSEVADGYLLYTVGTRQETNGDPELDQALGIRDFVWRDMNAYRGLWDFVRAHDLVGKVTTHMAAEDDPAPSLLLEPRLLQAPHQRRHLVAGGGRAGGLGGAGLRP